MLLNSIQAAERPSPHRRVEHSRVPVPRAEARVVPRAAALPRATINGDRGNRADRGDRSNRGDRGDQARPPPDFHWQQPGKLNLFLLLRVILFGVNCS